MDEDRRIRFLIAPLIFMLSLLWGWQHHKKLSFEDVFALLAEQKIGDFIAALFGATILIFTLGVIIGTLTYVILRMACLLKREIFGGSGYHEIALSPETSKLIWDKIHIPGQIDLDKQFYVGSTFDHDYLLTKHPGIHSWLMRRWNAFSVAVTSTTGLFLSLLIGRLLGFSITKVWWLPVSLLCAMFGTAAYFAWRDTMGMIEFQAQRKEREADAL